MIRNVGNYRAIEPVHAGSQLFIARVYPIFSFCFGLSYTYLCTKMKMGFYLKIKKLPRGAAFYK